MSISIFSYSLDACCFSTTRNSMEQHSKLIRKTLIRIPRMSKGLQQYNDYIDNNIEATCKRYGYKRDKIKKVCNIKMSDKEIEDTMTKYVESDSYQEDLDVFFKKNTKSTRFQQYNDYVNENIGAPCHRYGYKRQDGTEICIKMSDKEPPL